MPDDSKWKVKTKRYVAFLDILGFKDYVLRHGIDDVYKRLQTLNALRPEDDNSDYDYEEGKRIKFTIFSDSIFIFSKDDSFTNFPTHQNRRNIWYHSGIPQREGYSTAKPL